MRGFLACVGWVGMLAGAAVYAQEPNRLVEKVSPASVRGRATVYETINRTAATNPVRNLNVYLLASESAKPFEELQNKCRRVMRQPKGDPVQIYQLCQIAQAQAFALVPTLPAMATAKTGADGSFTFDNVAPGRSYHVIGIKSSEDGSPIVIATKTSRLRPGQRLDLELSENSPWTGPIIE